MNEEKLKRYLRKYTGSLEQSDQVTKDRIKKLDEIFEEDCGDET